LRVGPGVEAEEPCYSDVVQATKESVRVLLEWLPDDCSLEDVRYPLYVIQKVRAGLADAVAGRLIPYEKVAEELRRKWVTGVDQ
jgi:hypothetical protein